MKKFKAIAIGIMLAAGYIQASNLSDYCEDLAYQIEGSGEILVGYTQGAYHDAKGLKYVISEAMEYQRLAGVAAAQCTGANSIAIDAGWAKSMEKKARFDLGELSVLSSDPDYIGTYTAIIGSQDHFNSRGGRLRSVADILQQDRANYHRYYRRNGGDSGDSFFTDKYRRSRMKSMLARGNISRRAVEAILYGNPTVKVDIYRNRIDVDLID